MRKRLQLPKKFLSNEENKPWQNINAYNSASAHGLTEGNVSRSMQTFAVPEIPKIPTAKANWKK